MLFTGFFDNLTDIAKRLDLVGRGEGEVYGAAVDRWGDEADLHCVGSYAAIVCDQEASGVRLARSPYDAPPLYYHHSSAKLIVASVPRVIFAAGVEARLNRRRTLRNLVFRGPGLENPAEWYEGVSTVPPHHIVKLRDGKEQRVKYYDFSRIIGSSGPVRDAPERANELLREAASKFLDHVKRPAMLLSGGLDSPLAATALLSRMAPGVPLKSFTFVPCADFDGIIEPGRMANERPLVEDFARMYPQIEPAFIANEGVRLDHGMHQTFLASGTAPINLSNGFQTFNLYRAAREAGCDGVAIADMGNEGFSDTGIWAFRRFFLSGRWGQLGKALRAPQIDWRSPSRRFAAYVLMPSLSPRQRKMFRRIVKGQREDQFANFSPMRQDLRADLEASDPDEFSVGMDGTFVDDRLNYFDSGFNYDSAGEDAQASAQIHNLKVRDITAYRPLMEFCLSLPPQEYLYDGVERRLARRMGEGILPDSIRLNRLYGKHGADWHARMTRQRDELRAEIDGYRQDEELSDLLDLDRMAEALDDWPEQTVTDADGVARYFIAVSRGVTAARFIRFVNGSNLG